MNWLIIIIVVALITGIIGALGSDDGEKGAGCLTGAISGGLGCGSIIFSILLVGVGLMILFKIFGFLFG